MFVLVWSDNELLKSDNTVEVFPTYDRAYHEMVRQLEEEAARDGLTLSEGPGDLTAVDEFGFETGLVGYLDESEAYLDHHGECKWVIFEVPDSPTPKRNPNVAETVGYECKNDPTFRSREVLLHQATVRWNSGKSFECHAPERVELRIGGTAYEYKAV